MTRIFLFHKKFHGCNFYNQHNISLYGYDMVYLAVLELDSEVISSLGSGNE